MLLVEIQASFVHGNKARVGAHVHVFLSRRVDVGINLDELVAGSTVTGLEAQKVKEVTNHKCGLGGNGDFPRYYCNVSAEQVRSKTRFDECLLTLEEVHR